MLQSAGVTINLHLHVTFKRNLGVLHCCNVSHLILFVGEIERWWWWCMKLNPNFLISSHCLCVCRLWVFIRTESSSLFSTRSRRVLMILIQFSSKPLLEVSTVIYWRVESHKMTHNKNKIRQQTSNTDIKSKNTKICWNWPINEMIVFCFRNSRLVSCETFLITCSIT